MLALADRWLGRYTRALDMLSGLCLAIMVVLVFGNVVLRYTMNSGITVSEELSRWWICAASMGSASITSAPCSRSRRRP